MAVRLASVRAPDVVADTARAQMRAADPRASAWVGANAGTGKTHVLTLRVVRLMLAGAPLDRILCLTYTQAAAAEMAKRVFAELARWAGAPEPEIEAALTRLLGHAPDPAETAQARALFARAIETPGGLKVQTIHAFSERLLQRFPLEAGVTPGFVTLDDDEARAAQRDAIDTVLREATRAREGRLGRALETAVRYAAGDSFDDILREALAQRAWIEETIRWPQAEGPELWRAVDGLYRTMLGVRAGLTRDAVDRELVAVIEELALERLARALAEGTSTDQKAAGKITAALAAGSMGARVTALEALFCTDKGEPRANLMTKGLKAKHPDLDTLACQAQTDFRDLLAERRSLTVVEATLALLELADAVMQRYAETKARRAALDFEDLVAKAARLLNPASYARRASLASWVHYRLDGGIDHILVDEAQDTSPTQWAIVTALADEFFLGQDARAAPRTLFAVGDEKQSIYGFQGASPEMFMAAGHGFAERARTAGRDWRGVSLDVSFRTVPPILAAVDRVFADAGRTPGLAAENTAVAHRSSRAGQGGLVEIWPVERPDDVESADPWAPLDEVAPASPVTRLAARIADTIRDWLDRGERLVSEDRPARAGDILILVRHRRPFAPAMVAALEARRVPVAGSDRIRLSEQIAVSDLLALGDVLLLPDDDLQLAALLKSPLFDLDDDDLLRLAHGRESTLWSALFAHAPTDARYERAAEALARWQAESRQKPPFEFYAGILDRDGGRSRMLRRLGREAADPIDEFMSLALTYDDGAPSSLAGFLQSLRASDREIKRDMEQGRDVVRVMTVHGAKGLEAPIVFLPDTCGTRGGGRNAGLIRLSGLPLPEGLPYPFVWAVKGAGRIEAIAEAREARNARERHERHRLLYVAMTRARDRLYVAGYESKRGRGQGCWYDLVRDALEPDLEAIETADGSTVWRLSAPQSGAHESPRGAMGAIETAIERPPWAARPAPSEPRLSVPVTPSGLVAYEKHEADEAPIPRAAVAKPSSGDDETRFVRGTLTHALLEHLPRIPADRWDEVAAAYIARRGVELDASARALAVQQALRILRDPAFAPLFGPQSRAEVPIGALLPRPDGEGPPLRVSGQIDRLALIGEEVLIIDYKTNRVAPEREADAPEAYIFQLAAYRIALRRIFSTSTIRGAILWTAVPRLMEIPPPTLDAFEHRFWRVAPVAP